MSKITICTGPSGVKVKECLERLNRVLTESRQVISVEDAITKHANLKFPDFLGLPSPILRQHWIAGAKQAIQEAEKAYQNSTPVFLTFHASYFHQRTRGFIPAIDLENIASLKGKVDKVLVFIDDIYDVYKRLMANGEMYEEVRLQEPKDAILLSIVNLNILLHWREIETALSYAIANYLGVKAYVVATKHPKEIGKRLIEKDIKDIGIYYLSHPITTIRREAAVQFPTFVGQLTIVIDTLLSNEDIVLFVPTTIDELAIQQRYFGKELLYVPEIDQRWAYDNRNTICPPLPKETADIKPINPRDYIIPKGASKSISLLLNHLWLQIYRHTVSRDYCLVEQSQNGIIAIRPLYEGHLADGVVNEIRHNLRLMKIDEDRSTYIYGCVDDREKNSVNRLFNDLNDMLSKPPDDLDTTKQAWMKRASEVCQLTLPELKMKLENEVLLQGYDFKDSVLSSQWSGELVRKSERLQKGMQTIWDNMRLDIIPYELEEAEFSGSTRIIYEIIEQHDFWNKLLTRLKTGIYHTRSLL